MPGIRRGLEWDPTDGARSRRDDPKPEEVGNDMAASNSVAICAGTLPDNRASPDRNAYVGRVCAKCIAK